jgi:type IV pilus assembly protein PilY1
MAHPRGGNLVIFGTGKFFESADLNNVQAQSLYGVWDKVATGASTDAAAGAISASSSGAAATGANSSLVAQTLTAIGTTSYYTASANAVDYNDKRGWFIRLNMSPAGLRLVFAPQLAVGRVFLQALSPAIDTANPCAARQGKSINFVLDPFTGSGSRASPTFDFNGDGAINALDTTSGETAINVVAVASTDTGSANFSQKLGTPTSAGVITDAGAQKTVAGAKNALRRSWRQIINRPTP